jgi:hypothetical protein
MHEPNLTDPDAPVAPVHFKGKLAPGTEASAAVKKVDDKLASTRQRKSAGTSVGAVPQLSTAVERLEEPAGEGDGVSDAVPHNKRPSDRSTMNVSANSEEAEESSKEAGDVDETDNAEDHEQPGFLLDLKGVMFGAQLVEMPCTALVLQVGDSHAKVRRTQRVLATYSEYWLSAFHPYNIEAANHGQGSCGLLRL